MKKPKESLLCSAVVVAAGSSSRMGGENKLFSLLSGVPVLARTLSVFEQCGVINEIVVVTRAEDIVPVGDICKKYGIGKVTKVICGGSQRTESALLGVMEVSSRAGLIAIHDGARPLVTPGMIDAAAKVALLKGAAICAVPVTDTLKLENNGIVSRTVDRTGLYAAQTPQVFQAELIKAALTNAVSKNLPLTDDAMAVELLGIPVELLAGSRENIKITYPADLLMVEGILNMRGAVV